MKVQGPQGAAKPQYFDDPAIDALYRMVLVLGEEIAVLQEQVHAMTALHAEGESPTEQALDAFHPDEAFDKLRQRFAERLLEPVQHLIDRELST